MSEKLLSGFGDPPVLAANGRDLIALVKIAYDRVEFYKRHFSIYKGMYSKESIDRITRHFMNTAIAQEAYVIGMYSR